MHTPDNITLHFVMIYRNKKDPNKHMMSAHTLFGEDLGKRMETLIIEADSWSDEWELVSFSHTYLPLRYR